ncbi:fibronectin type III domain-containing protein [Geothrix sp. PMB-07]|uniref:fibronectin type III domain-containing protein n=1 Tax=Geothrix sp. PMB-07 TaxID=3068640 RepID=UPI002740A160|nr:fibronectin type III domain-containing protein [Geothrix sp. PMB-07]WLT30993.1 fibronectin type III domain-containing protein [Geothrix sp. PMB-07]
MNRAHRSLFLCLLGTLSLFHCGGGGTSTASTSTPAQPMAVPVISAFTAMPATISVGASSTLAWNVSGATSLSIDQGAPAASGASGSVSVSPAATTTYTLTATNSAGTATAKAQVTVAPLTMAVSVAISPVAITVQAGKTQAFTATVAGSTNTAVTWSVVGSQAGSISSGGLYTAPDTAGTFQVKATSVADTAKSATATVTVTSAVPAPVITAFTATPASVAPGASSSLSWTVTGATSLTIGGLGDVTGKSAATVTPATTTTYTLTASNGGATTTAEATVVVQSADGKPIIRFFFIKPMAGGFDLVWYVSGADKLSIDQGVQPISDASGEVFLGRPDATTTYTLTATNGKGATTAKATYAPDPPGSPSLAYFVANPANIPSGGASTLAWGFAYGTQSLTLDDGATAPVAINAEQTRVVHPTATTTYTITLAGSTGVISKQQVTVRVAPQVPPSMTYYDPSLIQSPIDEAVAANLKAISARGVGLRPDAFMRVGDVLTWSLDTLGPFDGANVNYGTHGDLQPTAQFFRNAKVPLEASTNSLTRLSIAAEENANARDTVTGNPSALDAEYQVAMPQYAVLMFGSNEVHWYNAPPYPYAFMATGHQIGMMDIVDNLLAKGVIPILTSMPPHPEDAIEVPSFVALERSIAQSRGIPFIDYNQAMLAIGPDYHWGIGADNLHPTNDAPGDLSAVGLHYGYAMRNLVTLTGLTRAKAVVHDGSAAPDAGAVHLAGAGTPTSPYLIPSLPYADTRNTQNASSQALDHYAGSTTEVPGKEVVYRLTLSRPTQVRIVMADRGAKILRVFLLDSTCTPAGCLASEGGTGVAVDGEILKSLGAGTYHIVVDSKDAGGEYSLMVLDADDIPPAPLNLAKGAATATSITLTWAAPASKRAIASYVIYRDDVIPVPVGTVAGTATSFKNTGLKASTSYNYKVVAVDSAGKASPIASMDPVSTGP